MDTWQLKELGVEPSHPRILTSNDEARAIALHLEAGEALEDHQVHERAWLVIVEGEVEVTSHTGERVEGGAGLLVEFAPTERHEVVAVSKALMLLLLTPWPGDGHPGPMTIEDKAEVRRRAAERAKD